jgi:hypothetical protein
VAIKNTYSNSVLAGWNLRRQIKKDTAADRYFNNLFYGYILPRARIPAPKDCSKPFHRE